MEIQGMESKSLQIVGVHRRRGQSGVAGQWLQVGQASRHRWHEHS